MPMNLFRRRAHPPELQDGGWDSNGVADPGIGGVCPEGGAHPRSRGSRHSGPSFGSPCSNLRRPPGPLCSAHFVPRPAAGNGGECSGVRAAPADADHQVERSASGRRQPRYALRPFYRRAAPPIPPSRHSSLRQGAWSRHFPSSTGWGSALDARGWWCGGASRAGPGGSTPAQQGSGRAADPSSGSDGEDSRAAGWAATPVNPGTTA